MLSPEKDIFESGTLSGMIARHLQKRGQELAAVTVTLRNGDSFEVAQMAVVKGFLMFMTEDPDELIFVPSYEVTKVHVTKLRSQGHVGFTPEPLDTSSAEATS